MSSRLRPTALPMAPLPSRWRYVRVLRPWPKPRSPAAQDDGPDKGHAIFSGMLSLEQLTELPEGYNGDTVPK